MNIYLVGYMGSGKSSAGKRLANSLQYQFTDLDDLFTEETGTEIGDFIRDHGEDVFRMKESQVLRNMSLKTDQVIATGGGTPCYHSNMEFMNETGITVYLKMHPRSIYKRLSEAKKQRPLLQAKSGEELQDFISTHLEARRSYYEKARIVVKGENLDIQELADQILNFN